MRGGLFRSGSDKVKNKSIEKEVNSVMYSKDDIDQQLNAQKKRKCSLESIKAFTKSSKSLFTERNINRVSLPPLSLHPMVDNDTSEMTVNEVTYKDEYDEPKHAVTPHDIATDLQGPITNRNKNLSIESRVSLSPVIASGRSEDTDTSFLSPNDPLQVEKQHNERGSNERERIHNERIEKQRIKTMLNDQQLMYEQMISDLCIRVDESRMANELLSSKLVEQTKISGQFEQLYESTKEEMEQIKVMTANTAHDLKSPLQTLVLGIESLRTIDPKKTIENIETINCLESACAFMSSAINRTIEYSRINSNVGLFTSNTSFDLFESLKNPVRWMTTTLPLHGKSNYICVCECIFF